MSFSKTHEELRLLDEKAKECRQKLIQELLDENALLKSQVDKLAANTTNLEKTEKIDFQSCFFSWLNEMKRLKNMHSNHDA